MTELILHHYDTSPFSEKVRLALGLKGLSWRSVIIPMVAPKRDLTVLTGGYRHTPVLQIGSDIYCDTKLILKELDRRYPKRPLVIPTDAGLNAAIEAWAERDLFWPIARYITGMNAEAQDGFHADRAALRGKKTPSLERVQAAARASLAIIEAHVPLIDSFLSEDKKFLLSNSICQADLAVYHALWFLSVLPIDCSSVLDPYPAIRSWMGRVAAVGHGESAALSSKDAIEIARQSKPSPLPGEAQRSAHDPDIGSNVGIRPDGYTTDDVIGKLSYIDRDQITISRQTSEAGHVSVHFPRIGYLIRRQS